MENKAKRGTVKKQIIKKPEWNDNISDLSAMRNSRQEHAKKMSSRQSHNLSIARAELMERNRQGGSVFTFSPALSSRLRASSSKSVQDALSDGSAVLALAQKVRSEEMVAHQIKVNQSESFLYNHITSKESLECQRIYQEEDSDDGLLAESDLRGDNEDERDLVTIQSKILSSSQKDSGNLFPLSPQGWENLNNTIQLVVKTCEALWQQLEEERMTRQRLHLQLQEQRSIITTLTAELIQIQEHQELILRELHSARSSSLVYSSAPPKPPFSPQRFPAESLRGRALPPPMMDRFSSRPFALSDSSIDMRRSPRKHDSADSDLELSADSRIPLRLNHQGKSKSVSQLNREQETMRHNAASNLRDASLMDLLQNYHITDG